MSNRLLASSHLWSTSLSSIQDLSMGDLLDLHHHDNYHPGKIIAAVLKFGIMPETLDVFFYRDSKKRG